MKSNTLTRILLTVWMLALMLCIGADSLRVLGASKGAKIALVLTEEDCHDDDCPDGDCDDQSGDGEEEASLRKEKNSESTAATQMVIHFFADPGCESTKQPDVIESVISVSCEIIAPPPEV
ncbi:MAG: hypothetical protein V4616_15270 [Bacteroidota bacterium]